MSRVAYVNGRYVRHAEAAIHIEDRGYQFSDGIYEVTAIWKGRPVDLEGHWVRLERSLREMEIAMPMSVNALTVVARETVRRNMVRDGILYTQVTRGVAPRNHLFPANTPPALVMTARNSPNTGGAAAERGIKVISQPDIRWGRRDIKTVSLLPNAIAKQRAHEQGAAETFLYTPDGVVTECSSSNAWMVSKEGALVTRPLSNDILGGITRQRLIQIAKEAGIPVEERSFTLEEAKTARELFLSSTTNFCMPIVQLDETVIGNGHPGGVTADLRSKYLDFLGTLEGPIWYGR
jgi:D-alanine transaminase